MAGTLGIDLGTANSAVTATLEFKGISVTITPSEGTLYGDNVIPSYIAFDGQGKHQVGLVARNLYFGGANDLIFRHIKRLIGRTYDYVADRISKNHAPFLEFKDRISPATDGSILINAGGREISVAEMAGYLLKKTFEEAQAVAIKAGEMIDSVVISLPAGFGDLQRQDTFKAAKLAGLKEENINIIEEPTAAAIAKGLSGAIGKIIVIDVGAGTTDVVIGHIADSGDKISMQLTSRECDDLLGGMDMDHLILEHVFHKNPQLKTSYEKLPFNEKCKLMGKIEDAKINALNDGSGTVAATLVDKEDRRIRVRDDFDEAELKKIVWPIINGYESTDGRKGIKIVIENALLQSAGGRRDLVPKVVSELEHIILVGGPCRMACMFDMLCDVFASNDRLMSQLLSLVENRLTEKFYMEGVSKGAALSKSGSVEKVMTITPEKISIYSYYDGGTTTVIMAGQPFDRRKGVTNTVRVKVHKNANNWRILHEKHDRDTEQGKREMRSCDMTSHIVVVPEDGELKVTYKFGERGSELGLATIEGCGLHGKILFPPIEKRKPLGKELEEGYIGFLSMVKSLPEMMDSVRNRLYRYLLEKGLSADEARQIVQSKLSLNQRNLDNCQKIQPDEAEELSDDEIKLALDKGIFEMRESVAKNRYLLSQDVIDVMDLIGSLITSSTSVQELIDYSHNILNIKCLVPECEPYRNQLIQYVGDLEEAPHDTNIAATAATALGLYADILYDRDGIPESLYQNIRSSCRRYRPDH